MYLLYLYFYDIMSVYILLQLFFIISLFWIWIFTYKKYKDYSWIFFIISMFFLWLWLLFYILIFWVIINKDILLYIFRIMYTFSFIWFYSMLFFVYYFWIKSEKINKKRIFIVYFLIAILFIFTSFVVKDLKWIQERGYYFEDYWIGYNFILILYLLFTPLFLVISYFKIKRLSYINNIRLKIIVFWFTTFIFLSILFYVIFPYFGIYLFENSSSIFLAPFIYSVLYSTNIYNFSDLKFKLWNLLVFSFSIFYSVILVKLFKYYSAQLPEYFSNFWWFSKDLWTVDLIIWIILFLISYHFLSKFFLWNTNLIHFEKEINNCKKYIPYILNVDDLNKFLEKHFFKLFKIKYIKIQLFNKKDNELELYKYFTKDKSRNLFMNDIVFIEENKYKFDFKKLKKEINNNVYLIFPLFNNKKKLIWIFEIWEKPFKEYFSLEEISIIKDFTWFLVGHLKYIEIYSKINDLNINLDKKVDEKTIEYNQLLNKQSEFISMASHEIKSPIWSTIFQIDFILDEIEDWNLTTKLLKKELNTLNNTLIKVWNLTNKIFSVQKYDLDKIVLYKQNINLFLFFNDILLLFWSINKNINLEININNNIWFLDIDKIQFTQVIDNLLNNALKFSDKNSPKISFILMSKWDNIFVEIEDNWKGFKEKENKIIFEKYNSENSIWSWIWLWLYLCKKIVELHWWSIIAEKGEKLWGAKFIIILPKKV